MIFKIYIVKKYAIKFQIAKMVIVLFAHLLNWDINKLKSNSDCMCNSF